MNLSDYISLTLNEIAEGVQKANKSYAGKGNDFVLSETAFKIDGIPSLHWNGVYKPIVKVGFRVGVEIEEVKEKGGNLGGSLKVVALNADITKKDGAKSIHEITFEIPLIRPKSQ